MGHYLRVAVPTVVIIDFRDELENVLFRCLCGPSAPVDLLTRKVPSFDFLNQAAEWITSRVVGREVRAFAIGHIAIPIAIPVEWICGAGKLSDINVTIGDYSSPTLRFAQARSHLLAAMHVSRRGREAGIDANRVST